MNLNTMCRCCLVRPPKKDLKSVYTCLGKTEVYGDMLKECFEIHLSIEPCDSENGICELCIARLRDASDFKHQVLRCQKEFQIKLNKSSDTKVANMPQIKEEYLDIEENNISALAEEERQENVGEFEEEKHSFVNQNYPGSDPISASGSSDEYLPSCKEDEVIKNHSVDSVCDESTDNITPEEEERQENVEEFEGEKHSFVNQDPGSDPFSASGSSDEYQPSCEEDEVIKSDFDDSVCDESTDNITPGTTKDGTNQTHSSDVPPTIMQFGPDQLEPSCAPSTCVITQQGGHLSSNLSEQDSSQRITRSNPQITKQRDHQQGQIVGKSRKKDFCFYCETHVLNFSRHIVRKHHLEVDVKKILALPKKSQTRRNLITQLKKKGNYILNLVRCERPMRIEKYLNESDYLPCPNCLGFYARKRLWMHKKKCNPEALGSHTQAEAQNLMCRNSPHTPSISLQKVFCRMRADKISFVVKQDALICKFGENYLKRHREEHFINHTSRKMRELAKLFIEIQKIKPDIRTFFDALRPQNYDVLIAATKVVAKYDKNSDNYCSPTYAINISPSIKQCCNIAITEILKTEPSIKSAEKKADLKTLVQLIASNWTSDVSSNAADDLNLNKWNRVTIVTLATDLKLLKDHLCSAAQKAAVQLKDEDTQDMAAYNILAETVFCRVLLLNRIRPGKLQTLLLSTYEDNERKEYQYEEFYHTLTATEKILVYRLKCIVIRGKRSSGVPVLFSTNVQQDLDLLISLRGKYIYARNKFLFAKPSGMTCLCGYKVLQKHVKLSGAKNPDAISSTKLRKYLATLTQLFNMTENDIEQLSNYMEHTTGVHRQKYRLTDDIFQTAKISKLLILIEDGQADSFKGKSLDEININMDEDLEGEGLQREDILDFAEIENALQESDMGAVLSTTTAQDPETPYKDNVASTYEPLLDIPKTSLRSTKKKRVLVHWTTPQKNLVINHFKRHIRSKKAPKRHECDALKDLHPELLQNKDWRKIKVFVQNYYSKH